MIAQAEEPAFLCTIEHMAGWILYNLLIHRLGSRWPKAGGTPRSNATDLVLTSTGLCGERAPRGRQGMWSRFVELWQKSIYFEGAVIVFLVGFVRLLK